MGAPTWGACKGDLAPGKRGGEGGDGHSKEPQTFNYNELKVEYLHDIYYKEGPWFPLDF